MNKLTILRAAWGGARAGWGGRLGRSLRDGCIAMTVFVVSAYGVTDQAPVSALAALASLTGADLSDPVAEAMVRAQLFGGHVLQGMQTAKLIAIASFIVRTALSAARGARAALRPEVTHA